MNLYDHVRHLRAVRNFLPEPIAQDQMEAILQAGRWTGSSKNLQNWAFVVIEEEEGRTALASAGRFSGPLIAAPLVVALVGLPEGYEFDIGRAAQNMMLAASALGIASCPVTLHMEDRAAAMLRLPPDHTCRYAIAFGIADTVAEEAARVERRSQGWSGRKPLIDLVHHGQFGRGTAG
ncbi:MAG: nitroreductase family protein [Acidimicrobiia bacterium]